MRAGAAYMAMQFAANEIDDHDDNDERLIAEQIHDMDTPLYTDGGVEEADPDRYITPPIIRLARPAERACPG